VQVPERRGFVHDLHIELGLPDRIQGAFFHVGHALFLGNLGNIGELFHQIFHDLRAVRDTGGVRNNSSSPLQYPDVRRQVIEDISVADKEKIVQFQEFQNPFRDSHVVGSFKKLHEALLAPSEYGSGYDIRSEEEAYPSRQNTGQRKLNPESDGRIVPLPELVEESDKEECQKRDRHDDQNPDPVKEQFADFEEKKLNQEQINDDISRNRDPIDRIPFEKIPYAIDDIHEYTP